MPRLHRPPCRPPRCTSTAHKSLAPSATVESCLHHRTQPVSPRLERRVEVETQRTVFAPARKALSVRAVRNAVHGPVVALCDLALLARDGVVHADPLVGRGARHERCARGVQRGRRGGVGERVLQVGEAAVGVRVCVLRGGW